MWSGVWCELKLKLSRESGLDCNSAILPSLIEVKKEETRRAVRPVLRPDQRAGTHRGPELERPSRHPLSLTQE